MFKNWFGGGDSEQGDSEVSLDEELDGYDIIENAGNDEVYGLKKVDEETFEIKPVKNVAFGQTTGMSAVDVYRRNVCGAGDVYVRINGSRIDIEKILAWFTENFELPTVVRVKRDERRKHKEMSRHYGVVYYKSGRTQRFQWHIEYSGTHGFKGNEKFELLKPDHPDNSISCSRGETDFHVVEERTVNFDTVEEFVTEAREKEMFYHYETVVKNVVEEQAEEMLDDGWEEIERYDPEAVRERYS